MKQILSSLTFTVLISLGSTVASAAECYADYKAKTGQSTAPALWSHAGLELR